MVLGGGVDRGELGGVAFDRALRVHDLGGADAGEVELHRQRLREQPRVALRDARAAAGADLDLDDALRFQRAQRVAGDDAADAEALGEVLLGAEEVARPQLLGEQRVAHLGDDLGGQGRAAERDDVAPERLALVGSHSPGSAAIGAAWGSRAIKISKMISFNPGAGKGARIRAKYR